MDRGPPIEQEIRPSNCSGLLGLGPVRSCGRRGFLFFIFKKNKISKIYVRFGKFQKYTPVALCGATWLKCNFFFFKFATKSLEKKKRGPVAPPTGDRPLSPVGGASPPFFPPGTSLQIWRKKNYTLGLSPYGRATGVYFLNFPKRRYIFEILFFFKYKKEKTAVWW